MSGKKSVRPIAIYLPQYHPVAENDEWWGKGFTEWTNVVKSKPLFEGHYQPHLPSDLGFYDLRLPETRQAQADLAKEYGIYGFCYYHYWFNGRRILERPFQDVFESGEPDFPFMLCWANENWTKVWDGSDKEILLKQNYCEEDDRKHIQSLIPYFKDDRYIKVDGKPVFIVYKSTELPDAKRTLEIWREEARKEGLELYLCRMERWIVTDDKAALELGFDAAVDFQPLSPSLRQYQKIRKKPPTAIPTLQKRIKSKLERMFKFPSDKEPKAEFNLYNLPAYVEFDLERKEPDYKLFPGVSPMWDNTARRKSDAIIFTDSAPEVYEKWLSGKIEKFKPYSKDENFVFINAWNEWAEGNHLEPCQKWGRKFLEATKRALSK
ncbi:MAG: glycosyl hydrolase [Bacteroidetes bacterium]|jgi:lipopolysaccharide biosynthesis protein|nr:glycosyl hydrolase [Bacteroidota bacterium]